MNSFRKKIENGCLGYRLSVFVLTALIGIGVAYAEDNQKKLGTTGIYTATGVTDSMSVSKYVDGFSLQFTTSDVESLWFEVEGCYEYNSLTTNFPFNNLDADNDTLTYNNCSAESTGVFYFPYRIGFVRLNILKLAGGASKQAMFYVLEN